MVVEAIDSFQGEYRFLSNFFVEPCGDTVEHFFQAMKTDDHSEQTEILNARTPALAKRLGRQCTLRSDWDEIKDQIMYELVRNKFQNPELAEMLLATGDAELIEGNWWGDTYWGVSHGKGQNKLGKILMRVRDELR